MKKFLLVLLLLAVASVPAFAAVQNVKVSGSLDNYYLYRQNFDLGTSGTGISSTDIDSVQSVFFSITKVGVAADLTDNVATTVELINERVWDTDQAHVGNANDYNSKVNLNLAYVTMKEMLYSPLTVVVGRQPLQLGSGLIVGFGGNKQFDSTALSTVARDFIQTTGYDAIRAILDYKPLTINLVYGIADDATPGFDTDSDADTSLSGIDAVYELGDKMNTVVEAYYVNRSSRSAMVDDTSIGQKADTVHNIAGRITTNPMERLNLAGEVAHQSGVKAIANRKNLARDAWAFEFVANYKIPAGEKIEKYKPMVSYVFNYFTGDTTTSSVPNSDNDWNGWDPMNESKNGGKIFNTLFQQTNYMMNQIAVSANPLEDLNAKFTYTYLTLDQGYPDATADVATLLYTPTSGTGVSVDVNDASRDLGQEFDLDLTYDYTEDVKICGNLGFFVPGKVFGYDTNSVAQTNNNETTIAKQAVVAVKVNF